MPSTHKKNSLLSLSLRSCHCRRCRIHVLLFDSVNSSLLFIFLCIWFVSAVASVIAIEEKKIRIFVIFKRQIKTSQFGFVLSLQDYKFLTFLYCLFVWRKEVEKSSSQNEQKQKKKIKNRLVALTQIGLMRLMRNAFQNVYIVYAILSFHHVQNTDTNRYTSLLSAAMNVYSWHVLMCACLLFRLEFIFIFESLIHRSFVNRLTWNSLSRSSFAYFAECNKKAFWLLFLLFIFFFFWCLCVCFALRYFFFRTKHDKSKPKYIRKKQQTNVKWIFRYVFKK